MNADTPWTCPFCSLLCDGYAVVPAGARLALAGSACPKAGEALGRFPAAPAESVPTLDGKAVDYATALDAAAELLSTSRQPLFSGLATDVAGARALYRLANACGAILDHARGEALMHSTRALQDRGVFYTTLAEIRNRADLVVCLGTDPADHYPEFFARTAPAPDAPAREVVFLGVPATEVDGCKTDTISLEGDLYTTLALLSARVAGRRVAAPPALEALAERMKAARYTVLMWESSRLDGHGALAAEAIQRLANTLNRSTRAAAFCLGGGDGGYTANQVTAWLSGFPLRTGVHPRGLAHEPVRYATDRLVSDGAVDTLLWVSAFGPDPAPPRSSLPLVALGHPDLKSRLASRPDTVFIPVSTPGIGSAGHLFRADGGVVLPLAPVYADTLPTVARVAADLAERLAARRAA